MLTVRKPSVFGFHALPQLVETDWLAMTISFF